MSCEYSDLDGAYVLGALSPGERQTFERHLSECAECSQAVRDLAGLPGLLAHVNPADIEPEDVPPPPRTLLPSVLRRVRATQRRRSAVVAAVAAGAAAVVVGGLAVGGVIGGGPEVVAGPTPTPSPAASSTEPGLPMEAVGASPVSADVLLSTVPWGTKLDLTCSYEEAEDTYEAPPDATYALVVRTRDGRTERVATWNGLPGRTMHLSAATATSRADIASLEMRTSDGLVVLRLVGGT